MYRVDARRKVPIFYLEDLLGVAYPHEAYYREELKKCNIPEPRKTFQVEKVLGSRQDANGTEQVKVKYRFYDNRFSKWIDKKDFVEQ